MLLAAGVLAGACSQTSATKPPTASSAITCPQAQRAPTFAPAIPTSRSLELVRLKGSDAYVVRDLTDILNVSTVATLPNAGSAWRFASPAELSYFDGSTIVRMPLAGSPRTGVACTHAFALAWNPNGTAAAYVTGADAAGKSELHLIGQGQNRLADSMSGNPLTDCVAFDCAERISVDLSYSPDGAYISYVQSWGGPVFRLWTADGRLVKSIDGPSRGATQSTLPGMAVWSQGFLFWRDASGVERWYNGRVDLIMPGVAWITPRASPGASLVVYATRDGARVSHVWLLNAATGEVRKLADWRSRPAFLNSHLIWYQEERPCVAADAAPCPASVAIPSGRTYIYDLQDGTESESVVQGVFDVWPHAA